MKKRVPKEILEVKELTVLADKGYYQADDLILYEKHHTTAYVPKQTQANATGNLDYYNNHRDGSFGWITSLPALI